MLDLRGEELRDDCLHLSSSSSSSSRGRGSREELRSDEGEKIQNSIANILTLGGLEDIEHLEDLGKEIIVGEGEGEKRKGNGRRWGKVPQKEGKERDGGGHWGWRGQRTALGLP